MPGDEVGALCAGVNAIDLSKGIPVKFIDEPPSSSSSQEQTKKPSGRKTNRAKRTQSSDASNEDKAINNFTRARKDSHSGNDIDNSTNQLAEVDTLKSELERLKQRNEELEKEVETYKVELGKVQSENCFILEELKDKKAELAACRRNPESGKEPWYSELQSLCGMEYIDFEEISVKVGDPKFWKKYNDDYSTETTLETVFEITLYTNLTFPYKEWKDNGNRYKGHDDGAISVANLFERFHAAKCGQEQRNSHIFIDKELWTREVMVLSKVIKQPLEYKMAQHAELQLLAFCITQLLKKRGFTMLDFMNPKIHGAGPEPNFPVTIYVSQPVCKSCQEFINKFHDEAGKYGWHFDVINRRVYSHSPGLDVNQRARPRHERIS